MTEIGIHKQLFPVIEVKIGINNFVYQVMTIYLFEIKNVHLRSFQYVLANSYLAYLELDCIIT